MARHHVIDNSVIAGRLEDTPEGFLICRDVPLARTGEQVYLARELPGVPAKNGQVVAVREEAEVFHPDAIASFRGKPLTDDHPFEDVSPANYKKHLIGVVQSPRRGEGAHAHCIVGDLMVYDPGAIAKIKSGRKRELSCGYDADYDVIEPGRARQTTIRGNHVSLVDEGRCGPTCAIRDKEIHAMPSSKRSFLDSLFKAFRAKDESEREEHLAAAEAALPEGDPTSEGDDANHHHVTVNIGGIEGPKPKSADGEEGDGEPDKGTDMDEEKLNGMIALAVAKANEGNAEAIAKAVAEATAPLQAKIDELTGALEDMSDPDDVGTQDAVARAEVLAPGIQIPVLDAKPGSKSHRDAMGQFQRNALKQAVSTADGRVIVGSILGHARSDLIARMPANEVAIAFRAASQAMYDANAQRTVSGLASATAGIVRDDKGNKRPMTAADINRINDEHYGRTKRA